jgi:hypothetical protein
LIEGAEIASGVWVLQHRETERNMGVILGEGGEGATVVNPGHLVAEQDALEKFVTEMGGGVACLLFTGEPEYTDMMLWPDAAFVTPTTGSSEASTRALAPGWEMRELSPGTYLGLYNKKERIFFCGDMLRNGQIPELRHGTQDYLDALDHIEALDVRLVLPLSGPEARGKREIKARIEQDRSYTMSVLRHVATSRAAHATLDRVIQVASQIYEDYPHLEAHLRNIRYAWEELAG